VPLGRRRYKISGNAALTSQSDDGSRRPGYPASQPCLQQAPQQTRNFDKYRELAKHGKEYLPSRKERQPAAAGGLSCEGKMETGDLKLEIRNWKPENRKLKLEIRGQFRVASKHHRGDALGHPHRLQK
jgi:hypothetical protein